MSTILSIDPGSTHSALVLWSGEKILLADKLPNENCPTIIKAHARKIDVEHVVCERVECYGMPVGKEVFETCFWTGRFWESVLSLGSGSSFILIPRREVKLHLCGQARAKDSNIRQALIDRFGGKGTKAAPGLTYNLKADTWQAFALAVTAMDKPELLNL